MVENLMEINVALVRRLIIKQFPEWEALDLSPVSHSGWDNRTFHLGTDMIVRLPSDKKYAPHILKEWSWLPKLRENLSIKIPSPIKLGLPSEDYPWYWLISKWIDGQSMNQISIANIDLHQLAIDLSLFLNELHTIDTTDGPVLDFGNNLSDYDHEMQDALPKIQDKKNREIAAELWSEALRSHWNKKPVWVHGDMAIGNILIKNKRLEAVIDFSGLALGDPANDLVVAWSIFTNENRNLFKQHIDMDKQTWCRAMGWVLWKTLCWPVKGTPTNRILSDIFQDFQQQ